MTYRSDLVHSDLRKQTSLTKRARNTQSPVFDLVIRGFRHVWGSKWPRSTRHHHSRYESPWPCDGYEKRADGDAIRIHYAAKLVDNLLDQWPREK